MQPQKRNELFQITAFISFDDDYSLINTSGYCEMSEMIT